MKKNYMTTIGGIMALFIGLPTVLGASHLSVPNWMNVAFIIIGTLGGGVIGLAAKGQDEHSDADEVAKATVINQADAMNAAIVKQVEQQEKK